MEKLWDVVSTEATSVPAEFTSVQSTDEQNGEQHTQSSVAHASSKTIKHYMLFLA